MKSDERVDNKHYIRRIQQEAKERELDERITRAEQERILKQKQLEQEEKLAKVKSILDFTNPLTHVGVVCRNWKS